MAVPLLELRASVYNAINTAKVATQYTLNNFELAEANVPITALEDFPSGGKIWVIGLASDDEEPATRTNKAVKKIIPIQVALQWKCGITNKTLQDQLITLEDQIRDTVRLQSLPDDSYTWLRTEALKDEDGTPFSFMGLREGLFEAYFTAFFLHIRS